MANLFKMIQDKRDDIAQLITDKIIEDLSKIHNLYLTDNFESELFAFIENKLHTTL